MSTTDIIHILPNDIKRQAFMLEDQIERLRVTVLKYEEKYAKASSHGDPVLIIPTEDVFKQMKAIEDFQFHQ